MTRFRRGAAALAGLAIATLALFAPTSTVWARELRADGMPPDLSGGQAGYYVWNDGHEVDVRMTDPGGTAALAGKLRTYGTFQDFVTDGPGDVHVSIRDHGRILRFRAAPGADLDGVTAHVVGPSQVAVRLRQDGGPVPADSISLGSGDAHPTTGSFTLHI